MKKIKTIAEGLTVLYDQMAANTCREQLMCWLYLFRMFNNTIKDQKWLNGIENTMTFTIRTTFIDNSYIVNEETQVDESTVRHTYLIGTE